MPEEIVVRISRRSMFRLLVIVALTAATIPAAAWASNRFTDVSNNNVFHNDITALADAGVTRGCNPPDNTLYCPDDVVTRGQMAAFLNRLGALSGQDPVVNASTLGGFGSEDFMIALEPMAALPRNLTFDLDGGARHECVGATSLVFEPDFQVFHQITSTPAGIDPWEINVQLDTRVPPNVGEGNYVICLATLDEGAVLPAGTYELNGFMFLQ